MKPGRLHIDIIGRIRAVFWVIDGVSNFNLRMLACYAFSYSEGTGSPASRGKCKPLFAESPSYAANLLIPHSFAHVLTQLRSRPAQSQHHRPARIPYAPPIHLSCPTATVQLDFKTTHLLTQIVHLSRPVAPYQFDSKTSRKFGFPHSCSVYCVFAPFRPKVFTARSLALTRS